jgi:hypothetical protein
VVGFGVEVLVIEAQQFPTPQAAVIEAEDDGGVPVTEEAPSLASSQEGLDFLLGCWVKEGLGDFHSPNSNHQVAEARLLEFAGEVVQQSANRPPGGGHSVGLMVCGPLEAVSPQVPRLYVQEFQVVGLKPVDKVSQLVTVELEGFGPGPSRLSV